MCQDKSLYTIVLVALFIMSANCKQPKYPKVSEWTTDALNNISEFQKYY